MRLLGQPLLSRRPDRRRIPRERSPGQGSAQPIAERRRRRPWGDGRERDNRSREDGPRSTAAACRIDLIDLRFLPGWDGAGVPGGACRGQSPARGALDPAPRSGAA